MNPEIEELLDELADSNAPMLNWTDTRNRIHALHEKSESFEERGKLLEIYAMIMESVQRLKLVEDVELFRRTRNQDYNLFLIRESTTGEKIDPKKLLAVCQRGIAAGRMASNSDMLKLAEYGDRFIGPPLRQSATALWWKRIFGR